MTIYLLYINIYTIKFIKMKDLILDKHVIYFKYEVYL
jgi:hypothetical protein